MFLSEEEKETKQNEREPNNGRGWFPLIIFDKV